MAHYMARALYFGATITLKIKRASLQLVMDRTDLE